MNSRAPQNCRFCSRRPAKGRLACRPIPNDHLERIDRAAGQLNLPIGSSSIFGEPCRRNINAVLARVDNDHSIPKSDTISSAMQQAASSILRHSMPSAAAAGAVHATAARHARAASPVAKALLAMQLCEEEVLDRQRAAARARAAVSAGTKSDRVFTRAAAKATALDAAACSPRAAVPAAVQECSSHAVGSPTSAATALDAAAMLLTPVRGVLLEEESPLVKELASAPKKGKADQQHQEQQQQLAPKAKQSRRRKDRSSKKQLIAGARAQAYVIRLLRQDLRRKSKYRALERAVLKQQLQEQQNQSAKLKQQLQQEQERSARLQHYAAADARLAEQEMADLLYNLAVAFEKQLLTKERQMFLFCMLSTIGSNALVGGLLVRACPTAASPAVRTSVHVLPMSRSTQGALVQIRLGQPRTGSLGRV